MLMKSNSQPTTKKIFIVIPAFNEEQSIESVLVDIKKHGFENIIVIDDGSLDKTYEIAKKNKVIVLRHMVNRGKGAATKTGLEAAKRLGADIAVTMDADGQHFAHDITNLINPILKDECEISLGNRMHKQSGMPFYKTVLNFFASLVTFLFYGLFVKDSQCGLRAYSNKAITLMDPVSDRYEFESEIVKEIHKFKLKFVEIDIKVEYTNYSKNRYNNLKDFQPQNIFNGIKMFFNMIINSIS